MFYQIFPSPQVKRWAIIAYKHGIYELHHELVNDLRLRILGKNENFVNTSKKLLKSRDETFPGVHYFT